MKRAIITLSTMAAIAGLILWAPIGRHVIATPPVVHAQNGNSSCSIASLNGTYALQGQGVVLPPGPPAPGAFGEVAIVHYNGAGTFFGSATVNDGGVVVTPTFTGTYTVNSDCTGSFTVNLPSLGVTLHDAMVVTGGGQGLIATEADAIEVVERRAERLGN